MLSESFHARRTTQVTVPRQPSSSSSNPLEQCALSNLLAVLGSHDTPALIIRQFKIAVYVNGNVTVDFWRQKLLRDPALAINFHVFNGWDPVVP